jgi:hypothetical protein
MIAPATLEDAHAGSDDELDKQGASVLSDRERPRPSAAAAFGLDTKWPRPSQRFLRRTGPASFAAAAEQLRAHTGAS